MSYDPREQLESEDPPSYEMFEGTRMICGAMSLAALLFGLLALCGGK